MTSIAVMITQDTEVNDESDDEFGSDNWDSATIISCPASYRTESFSDSFSNLNTSFYSNYSYY